MDTPKTKNFIIALLLLLNAFLLLITISDLISGGKQSLEERRSLVSIIGSMGITVADETSLSQRPLRSINLTRDLKKEYTAVNSLLGSAVTEDLGGNIYHYSGRDGEASFYGSGEFSILFNTGAIPIRGGLQKTALRVLSKLRIDPDPDYLVSETDPGGVTALTLRCGYDGSPVYSCVIKFSFNENCLLFAGGTRTLDYRANAPGETGADLSTALIRFLGDLPQSGKVFSEIINITPGYETISAVSGESALLPVWRIETDTGEYTIRTFGN